MTQEAERPDGEEPPAPPASTRWQEDAVQEDDTLSPPFTPGRPRGEAAAAESAPEPTAEPTAEPAAGQADEGRFPFELEEPSEGPTPGVEWEESEPVEPVEPVEAAPSESPEDEAFPFEAFDIEGDEAAAEAKEPLPGLDTEEAEDPWAATPATDPTSVPPPAAAEPAAEEASATREERRPHEDVTQVLERMAGLLREGGLEAVRGEMHSDDPLTSLLAGLVAGYVSGRG